ncbi:MAG TPA: flagellar hook-associated protein FlgL, partial [Epulopiscium sp.]|nr:flagellar hook-associated protein FlgL [Candidatus Epulonipiscium sp.]
MRVTNAMLKNNMMLGLNKNMGQLNTLYDQMNSLKKIQRPSDDPIILGRSLKLRLNVLETEQYKTNVGEARSWMEVSDKAIENVHEIINEIRTHGLQAANDTLKTEDRQKVMESIKQLRKQLTQESNANYAGRNVFGGYKTDKKVLF